MNRKFYIYRKMAKPTLKRVWDSIKMACIIWFFASLFVYTVFCILELTDVKECFFLFLCSYCLGFPCGFLCISAYESIWIIRHINRAFRFAKEFDNLEDACFSYRNLHNPEETTLIFGEEVYRRTVKKYHLIEDR